MRIHSGRVTLATHWVGWGARGGGGHWPDRDKALTLGRNRGNSKQGQKQELFLRQGLPEGASYGMWKLWVSAMGLAANRPTAPVGAEDGGSQRQQPARRWGASRGLRGSLWFSHLKLTTGDFSHLQAQ